MIRGAWGRDPLLPRAFSLMSVGAGRRNGRDVLAKTVGRGTALLERALPGAEVDVLGPLGTSFPTPDPDTRRSAGRRRGGAAPPLHAGGAGGGAAASSRARRCCTADAAPRISCCCDEMKAMGLALYLTTEDGAVGTKGLVTRALEARLDAPSRQARARDGLRPERDAVGGRRASARERERPVLHLAGGEHGVRHRRLPRLRDSGALAPLPLRLQQRPGVRRRRRARRQPPAATAARRVPRVTAPAVNPASVPGDRDRRRRVSQSGADRVRDVRLRQASSRRSPICGALGGLVTKGISPKPRFGNATPRICETASGMLNSIGLENVGVEGFERDKLPYLRAVRHARAGELLRRDLRRVRRLRRAAGSPRRRRRRWR